MIIIIITLNIKAFKPMGAHHMILAGEWLLHKSLASKLSFLAGEWLLGKPPASKLCLFIDPQGRSGINAP